MRIVLIIGAVAFAGLALGGLMAWGLISLLLLVVSAACLAIAWKLRPRRAATEARRRP